MRVGLTTSIIGHAVILGLGLVALSTNRLESEKIDALPVDLVSIDEATDLLKGDKSSRVLPEEAPQPKPEVKSEVPAPQARRKAGRQGCRGDAASGAAPSASATGARYAAGA